MGTGQVHHVDVIAHAAAVGGVVVVAEDGDAFAQPGSGLGHEGDQVVGHADGQFTDAGRRMGADGIEIAQQHGTQAGRGGHVVAQQLLAGHLGEAVGRAGVAVGRVLGHRQAIGLAVHGAAAGEHDAPHIVPLHHTEQGDERADVVAVVAQGLLHALAHGLVRREMHHPGDGPFGPEDPVQGVAIGAIDAMHGGHAADDGGNALQRALAAVAQVVHDHRLQPGGGQFHTGV